MIAKICSYRIHWRRAKALIPTTHCWPEFWRDKATKTLLCRLGILATGDAKEPIRINDGRDQLLLFGHVGLHGATAFDMSAQFWMD